MNCNRITVCLIATLVLLGVATTALTGEPLTDPRLEQLLENGPRPLWIFLADKGSAAASDDALIHARSLLSERALARRAKVLPPGALVSWTDIPVAPEYIADLESRGFGIRAVSRWLNAVTVVADATDLARLTELPYVARIAPVAVSSPKLDTFGEQLAPPFKAAPGTRYDDSGLFLGDAGTREDPIDYGASLGELTQANVPVVHQTGNHGEGVVIGMMDTGFNTTHEALDGLDILGTWDFINDDGNVANEGDDPESQQNHGTMTLSTIAGHKPGSLVGPAFGASFYLAKTEDTSQEEPIEEDWWQEGIEWLEAQGCDLVSSSLCYKDWYTFDDMDGNTAVTTIAADYAVSLGMLVINSAGNYRVGFGHIAAPADGDSVIAVGAVEISGEIAGFSSPGPSADGRIKPDVSAMGVDNNVVIPGTYDEYRTASGTSFACPLTAGVAALVLSAHPSLDPIMVRTALRLTADMADDPNNDYGWGIIDAMAAIEDIAYTAVPELPTRFALQGNYPNPFNPETRIAFSLESEQPVQLEIFDVRGRLVRSLLDETLAGGGHTVTWRGSNDAGQPVTSGVYFARLQAGEQSVSSKMILLK